MMVLLLEQGVVRCWFQRYKSHFIKLAINFLITANARHICREGYLHLNPINPKMMTVCQGRLSKYELEN